MRRQVWTCHSITLPVWNAPSTTISDQTLRPTPLCLLLFATVSMYPALKTDQSQSRSSIYDRFESFNTHCRCGLDLFAVASVHGVSVKNCFTRFGILAFSIGGGFLKVEVEGGGGAPYLNSWSSTATPPPCFTPNLRDTMQLH